MEKGFEKYKRRTKKKLQRRRKKGKLMGFYTFKKKTLKEEVLF